MALDAPAQEVELRHDADRTAAVAHDLAVALHRRNAARESFALVPSDLQQLFQLRLRDRHPELGQSGED
jgi:hypothetical protein